MSGESGSAATYAEHGGVSSHDPMAGTRWDGTERRCRKLHDPVRSREQAAAEICPEFVEAIRFALPYLEDHAAESHDDIDYAASVELAGCILRDLLRRMAPTP